MIVFLNEGLKGPTSRWGALVLLVSEQNELVVVVFYVLIAYPYKFGVEPKLVKRYLNQTKSTLFPKGVCRVQ